MFKIYNWVIMLSGLILGIPYLVQAKTTEVDTTSAFLDVMNNASDGDIVKLKYDIDKFTITSEILIGKNTHNMENRKQIMESYDKYKKYIPYEIGVITLLSLIVIFLK